MISNWKGCNRRAVCERPSRPSTQNNRVPLLTADLCARWRLAKGGIVSAAFSMPQTLPTRAPEVKARVALCTSV
jgi:hypothetical protein